MEALNNLLDRLLNSKPCDSSIYSHLNQCSITENDIKFLKEYIFPKIFHLCANNILKKNIIYISLLSNHKLIEIFTEYERSLQAFDLKDASFCFNYVMYERKHWLSAALMNFNQVLKQNINPDLKNVIILLKLVEVSNSPSLDHIEDLQWVTNQASDINYPNEFWEFYVQEIRNALHVVRFCKSLKPDLSISESKIFTYMIRNTFLDTLSCFIPLDDCKHWEKIRHKLQTKERDIFTSFMVQSMLVNSLILKSTSNGTLDQVRNNVKEKILQLNDEALQEEVLENIFSLIFHTHEKDPKCGAEEIEFILSNLEQLVKDLQNKTMVQSERLHKLHENIANGLWRLRLIINLGVCKDSSKMLHYMLAPPESLVHLCLKKKDFQAAHEVIVTCGLTNSDLESEINTAEKFYSLGKMFEEKVDVKKIIRETLPKLKSENFNDTIEKYGHKYDFLQHFDVCNKDFMMAFDLALGETTHFPTIMELSREFYNLNESITSNFANFYHTLQSKSSEGDPIKILSTIDSFKEEPRDLTELQNLYADFQIEITRNAAGGLNQNHKCHDIALRMIATLEKHSRSENQYVQKVFKYLKSFSRIFYLGKDNSDIVAKGSDRSYFELLSLNRSELTGNLLFERHVNPSELENYFGRLKLDFLYHVVGNCFPTINLHVQQNIKHEDLYHDNMLYTPSAEIINYIQRSNWLLACILCKMYDVQGVSMDVSLMRLSNFLNFLKTPRIQSLKQIYGNNEIITALQNCIIPRKIQVHFDRLIKQDLLSINSYNGSETSEDVDSSDWESFYNVIESVPENQVRKHSELTRWKNELLIYTIRDKIDEKCRKCIYFITDDELRYEAILSNFKKWNSSLALAVIESELSRFNPLDGSKLDVLHQWLRKIMISDQFGDYCDLQHWHKSYNVCLTEKSYTLRIILNNNNIDLLLDYIDSFDIAEDLLSIIDANYVSKILDSNVPLEKVQSLVNHLSDEQVIGICNCLLKLVTKLQHFQFVIDNLGLRTRDVKLEKIRTSLKILSALDDKEHSTFFPIIHEPLTILEVLLMNTRLDELAKVLQVLNFANDSPDNILTRNDVDVLLRQYAEKSLIFFVIINPSPAGDASEGSETKLLQSVDSISLKSYSSFIMPDKVPLKEDWVPNDEVSECMCCLQVSFSMFNRRHHCRRCGRVVCYSCSLKRMIVPNYGDILVRVCKDCFTQTEDSSQLEKTEVNVVRMVVQENWILNDDPQHDKIVREEFSYEHSPSISLCLSILKYHSKSDELTKFLLEQCEMLLKLIESTENSDAQELDIPLVIKMLKCLAVAANLSGGSSAVNRILSQADLLSLLSKRGFLGWYPKLGSSADTWVLRKLRDKLIECEEWNLALDVSTKAGLNNLGVFAAWGKNCLEAGSLVQARDKFQRCLEKNFQTETSSMHRSESTTSCDSMNLSQSIISSKVSITSSELRSSKDPPLLREIIAILEKKTRIVEDDLINQKRKILSVKFNPKAPTVQPISILNRIRNLEALASGKYAIRGNSSCGIGTKIDNIFYEECIYYLKKYGSNISLLDFYVKHGNVNQALMQILESKFTGEVFVEFYIKCLKNGLINIVQENMSKIDPSLDVWTEYLTQICSFLERHNLLNSLYQLQIFIGDYVRASITCVRFYEDNVKLFKDFASNNPHLVKSELHLNQALADAQWVELAPEESSPNVYGERTLSNPHLVMVIDPKAITNHIETIKLQIGLVNYLIQCETVDNNVGELLNSLYVTSQSESEQSLPTLFGSQFNKIILAALSIISGKKIAEGFSIAIQIVRVCKIKPIKVYCLAGKQLGVLKRHEAVLELVNCIKSAEPDDVVSSDIIDEVLSDAIAALIKAHVNAASLEGLTKLIKNRSIKISAYITMGQLKTAYFLAVKYKRIADIKRIQREAEILNLSVIKNLCQKYLRNNVQASVD